MARGATRGRAPDGRAEARRAARGAVRGHARPARPDRHGHRRAARRLALAGLRRRRAGAGHDAALGRPHLRRGGRRRPRDHRQGRAARAARPRRLRAPRPRLRGLPDGARGAPGRREPGRGRAPPRGDADRDQVPAHGRALLRADRPPGRGDRGQGVGRAGAARRARRRDRRPRRHRAGRWPRTSSRCARRSPAAPRAWSPTGSPTSCAPPRSTSWSSGCGRRAGGEDRADRVGRRRRARARGPAAGAGAGGSAR